MITEKDIIKCESVFNDDHTHRYIWKRVWSKDKPMVAVLMLNPCLSDNLMTDPTTDRTANNVVRLETYGGVAVLNLFSLLTKKLNFRWNSDEDLNTPDNDICIQKTAEECEAIILAWGKSADTNQRIADRAAHVIRLLEKHKDKLYVLSDGTRTGLHPLTPALRTQWILEPFDATAFFAPAPTTES
ncbi:MAG: DUF1643 domain-containing protein [Oscillospiraceae bacterium]|nr:DUF1643 domain-containing protein [Oscillospiraceae bacterium]